MRVVGDLFSLALSQTSYATGLCAVGYLGQIQHFLFGSCSGSSRQNLLSHLTYPQPLSQVDSPASPL